jgi:hypothetical protein
MQPTRFTRIGIYDPPNVTLMQIALTEPQPDLIIAATACIMD